MRWFAAVGLAAILLAGCGRKEEAPAPAARASAGAPFSILAGSELKDLEPAIVDEIK